MNLPKYGYTFTIPLTQNQQAMVDEKDWHRLRKYKWCAMWSPPTKSYRASNGKLGYMHRAIFGISKGTKYKCWIDHINHNTLDNRRNNLQRGTPRANSENRKTQSPYGPGVHKKRKKYQARACMGMKYISLGCYNTPEEARQVREKFLYDDSTP